ncbi:MAG TPA: amino acid permease [Gemmatimonadales bacterium]|jgi:APA family basic amino acid/polyamine antiporter|nr:amino acid permease [Gemmatimonadales bacterium]
MTVSTKAPETVSSAPEFIRGIGPLAAVSLVVGSMIGSGIFIVSADISRQVATWGPAALLLVWVITGAMTVTGALAYAELAAMIPRAGGQYVFLREGLSPAAGFLYGWTLFMVIQTGTIAAVAVAFGKFLSVLIPGITPDVFLSLGQLHLPGAKDAIQLGLSHQRVVAILMIVVLTLLNMRGVKLGAAVQTVFSVAKIGALAVLVILGLTLFRQPAVAAQNFSHLWGTGDWSIVVLPVIGAAMVGSLFSADAWNNVTFAAAEVREPTKNLPRALALGTGLVCTLYVLANVAYLNILPFYGDPAGADALARGIPYAAQDRVGTAAIEVALGAGAATIMAIAILLSTFGCNNGLILSGPRVYYAMARDRLFFESAGRLHPGYRTPVFGLMAQAVWASVLCISGTYNELLNYVIFATLIFYLLTTVSLFRLRRLRPDLPRPVRAFGYPILPALYICANAFLLVVLLADPQQRKFSALGLLIVATGIPVYLLWRRASRDRLDFTGSGR